MYRPFLDNALASYPLNLFNGLNRLSNSKAYPAPENFPYNSSSVTANYNQGFFTYLGHQQTGLSDKIFLEPFPGKNPYLSKFHDYVVHSYTSDRFDIFPAGGSIIDGKGNIFNYNFPANGGNGRINPVEENIGKTNQVSNQDLSSPKVADAKNYLTLADDTLNNYDVRYFKITTKDASLNNLTVEVRVRLSDRSPLFCRNSVKASAIITRTGESLQNSSRKDFSFSEWLAFSGFKETKVILYW